MSVQPQLQPLTGETFLLDVKDAVRLDVAASSFGWSHHQKAFFDVKVFNPNV